MKCLALIERHILQMTGCAALALSLTVGAQAPVENGPRMTDSVLNAQQKAGHAHGVWQDALAKRERAEQDYHEAQNAYTAAEKAQTEAKAALVRTKQAFEAARTRESHAQAAYDGALKEVAHDSNAVRKK